MTDLLTAKIDALLAIVGKNKKKSEINRNDTGRCTNNPNSPFYVGKPKC